MKRIIRVGIVQQACTNDIKLNLEKLHRNIASVAQTGAQLVILQELHNTPYFCQTEDTNMFDLAEPIPGPSTGFYSELAAAYHVVLVTSLFERRARGSITIPLWFLIQTEALPENTVKCTYPMILLIMKSFILHRAT